MPRRFELHRDRDISKVSGLGVVADGVQYDRPMTFWWPDTPTPQRMPAGWCRVVWRCRHRSIVLWSSIDDLVAVNGHGGATRVVWLDPPGRT